MLFLLVMFDVNVEEGVYKFSGEIDIYDLEDFYQILTELFPKEAIILDFGDVRSMDTAALQLLISFKKSLPKERKFKIAHFHPALEKMLTISGLSRYLN